MSNSTLCLLSGVKPGPTLREAEPLILLGTLWRTGGGSTNL